MEFWTSIAVAVILRLIKDPKAVIQFKRELIKVRDALNLLDLGTAEK